MDPSERFAETLDCGCEWAQGTWFYCMKHQAESMLDLRAVEARLLAGIPAAYANPKFQQWADVTALLAHCRALRAALAPFARHGTHHLAMLEEAAKKDPKWQPEDSHPAVCSYCMGKDEAVYTWGDLRRAPQVLASCIDREE